MTTTYIPNKLREYRKKAGLRQRDVADYLGLESTDRISRWEKGLSYPRVPDLFRLARLFKAQAIELYK